MLEADFFDYRLAIDPTAGIVVPNATAKVYAIADTTFASPLPITDVTGAPIAGNELVASPTGVLPQFMVPSGETQVMVRTSLGVVTPVVSEGGVRAAAELAQAAAAGSASEAASAAAAAAVARDDVVNAVSGKLDTAEAPQLIRDTMGATLVGGANVTVAIDEEANTVTISAVGGAAGRTYGAGVYGEGPYGVGTESGGGSGGGVEVFAHGSNAAAIRPTTTSIVMWVGTVEPDNWIDDDIWVDGTVA